MSESAQEPAWLTDARRVASDVLWPAAQDADQGLVSGKQRLDLLASSGLLGVNVPRIYGGHGGGLKDIGQLLETLASACGVTTFITLQHITACALIATSDNQALKETWLPKLATGEEIATVGFSQVRRPGPPMVRCIQDGSGYTFEGAVPWSTGWSWASQVVLGGILENGHILFALAPTDSPGMTASDPMPLCAMQATSTVSVTLAGVKVGAERHMKTITREEMARSDDKGMYIAAHLSFGATLAALRVLNEAQTKRPSPALAGVIDRTQTRLSSLKAECNKWIDQTGSPDYARQGLTIRADAITLAVTAAHAAVVASSGSANNLSHPAQRIMREATLYSLTAQTKDLQQATLEGMMRG